MSSRFVQGRVTIGRPATGTMAMTDTIGCRAPGCSHRSGCFGLQDTGPFKTMLMLGIPAIGDRRLVSMEEFSTDMATWVPAMREGTGTTELSFITVRLIM